LWQKNLSLPKRVANQSFLYVPITGALYVVDHVHITVNLAFADYVSASWPRKA